MKTTLTDSELWRRLREADRRKSDKSLSIDLRIRSAETFAECLREAESRGYDYATIKARGAQLATN